MKFTDISAFSPLDKGEPGENLYYVLYECLYLPVIYGHLCLTEAGRGGMKEKAYMTENRTGPKRMLTSIPLTQNPPPGSTGFGPEPRISASL